MKVLFILGRWARDVEKSKYLMELREYAEVEITLETDQKVLSEKAKDVEVIITGAPITATIIETAITKLEDNLLVPLITGFVGQLALFIVRALL